MGLVRGNFGSDAYLRGETSFTCENYLEPQLVNQGTAIIYMNGFEIQPGDQVSLGSQGVIVTQKFNITYGSTGEKKFFILYNKVECN